MRAHPHERQIILHQVVHARQVGLDLGQGLGNRLRTVRGGLRQLFREQIHVQKDRRQGVTDFVRHTRRQAPQQGEVLGPPGLALQALALGHGVVQGCGALLDALFEGGVGLLERRLGGLRGVIEPGILESPRRHGGRGPRPGPGPPHCSAASPRQARR